MSNKLDEIIYRLYQLPRRARVAFAARCARRVQPLVDASDMSVKRKQDVAKAIEFAEYVSSVKDGTVRSAIIAGTSVVRGRLQSAVSAAESAHNAAADYMDGYSRTRGRESYVVAVETAYVAVADDAKHMAADRMVADADLLFNAAERQRWRHETPVPPTFFGPMWPDGAPEGWPEDSTSKFSGDQPTFSVFIDPGDAPSELITEFLVALECYYRSLGGSGLEIVKEERREFIVEGA